MMIYTGGRGEASSTSIVPVSFSRTIEIEVISVQSSITIIPMIAGTKLYSLFDWGL